MANVVQIAVSAINNTAGGLHGAQQNVSSFGGRMQGVLAGAGAVGAGLFAQGLESAMDLSSATSKLQNQLGLTDKEADRAGKVAGNVFSDGFGGSLDEVTDALGGVNSSIGKLGRFTDQQLGQMSEDALALAKTFGVDVNEATSAVGQMMKTGLVKDATEGFDVITKGMQSIPAQMRDDILPTFQEYGTQFRKVGLDGKTSMGLLSQGLKAGARDADIVADSIKEFSIRAVDGSKLTAKGFQQVGLDAGKMSTMIGKGGASASKGLDMTLDALRNIKDPLKRGQAATALFGTQAEDMGAALFALDPSSAAAASGMDKAGGAAKGLTDKMKASPAQQMDKAMRTLKTSLGEALLPVVKNVTKFMSKHSDVIKQVAPYVTALAVAIGVWVVAQTALNFALAANPIGLVVIAIAALVGGLIYAYKHSQTFRDIVISTFNDVKLAGSTIAIVLLPVFKMLVDAWMTTVGGILHGAAKAFGWVPGLGDKLKTADKAFGNLKKGVDDKFDAMSNKAKQWQTDATNAFKVRKLKADISDWQSKLDAAKRKLKSVPDSKKAKIRADISDLSDKILNARAKINSVHGKTITFTYRTIGYIPSASSVNAMSHQNRATGGVVGMAATGGARGNRVMVGEHGPEIVDLAPGSHVMSNPDTRSFLSGGGQGASLMHITLQIGDKALGEVVIDPIRRIVRSKGGNVQAVLGN